MRYKIIDSLIPKEKIVDITIRSWDENATMIAVPSLGWYEEPYMNNWNDVVGHDRHIVTFILHKYHSGLERFSIEDSSVFLPKKDGYFPVRWYIGCWDRQEPEQYVKLLGWLRTGRQLIIHFFPPSSGFYPVPQRVDLIEEEQVGLSIGKISVCKGLGL